MVILSVGVRPETTLAKEAGLKLGARGAFEVNEHMQTNDPDIYAIGDAVSVKNIISGKEVNLPWLVLPANKRVSLLTISAERMYPLLVSKALRL